MITPALLYIFLNFFKTLHSVVTAAQTFIRLGILCDTHREHTPKKYIYNGSFYVCFILFCLFF